VRGQSFLLTSHGSYPSHETRLLHLPQLYLFREPPRSVCVAAQDFSLLARRYHLRRSPYIRGGSHCLFLVQAGD
jgi:hypothetical protein